MYHFVSAPYWGRAVSLMIDGCFHSFIVIMSLPLSFASCMSHSHVLAVILCLCTSLFCHSSPCLSCPRDLWGWGCLALPAVRCSVSVRSKTHTCHHVSLSCAGCLPVPGSSSFQLGPICSRLVPGLVSCPHA